MTDTCPHCRVPSVFSERDELAVALEAWALEIGAEGELKAKAMAEKLMKLGFRKR